MNAEFLHLQCEGKSNSVGIATHLHLFRQAISFLEEVSRNRSNIPRLCSPKTTLLQRRKKSVGMHRAAQDDPIPLTDSTPHQEWQWKVSDLNTGQDKSDAGGRGYSQLGIVRTLEHFQLGSPLEQRKYSHTGHVFRFPCVIDLDKVVRFTPASLLSVNSATSSPTVRK